MAKRTKSQQIGDTGEYLVGKLVSEMGHIWRPNPADFGIDGQVEIVDRDSHATGKTVSVQIKTTAGTRVPGESEQAFSWTCSAKDLQYWLGASEPVLLVIVRLDQQRAWWKRLDTWFADARRRKSRVVTFDKVDDLLGPGCEHQIAAVATPVEDPLPLVRSSETLTTNLLAIKGFAPVIYWSETEIADRQEAWAAMTAGGHYESGFILSGGRVYSFVPLTGALGPLCKGSSASLPTSDWAESEDPDVRRNFVSLLNFTVRAMHYKELRFHQEKHYVFHVATSDLKPRKMKVGRGSGRTVFEIYRDAENKVRYCRHYAAFLTFRQWDGSWYLEITPTYHFTRDGERESLFSSDQLAKIKRFERNAAVKGHIEHWAQFLAQAQSDTLFDAGDRRIQFTQLATVTVDASLDERAWIVPKEAESLDMPLTLEDGAVAS
jgi:hypothetical protein